MTDVRKLRGMRIAATIPILKKGESWLVPSESRNGYYKVSAKDDGYTCDCPDYELRQKKCKHQWAVEFTTQRETLGVASDPPPRTPRKTYPQKWALYNLAQTTEKEHFCHLLRELCGVAAPETVQRQERGRPRLPLEEILFASAYKVYSSLSGRRFMTDLRGAKKDGLIEKVPCYNSIFQLIEKKSSTALIKTLIELSSLPLRSIESTFAADSTGFGLHRFYRHYSAKYGHDQFSRDYIKVHVMVGVKTHVITAVEVTDRNAHDSPQFRHLLSATHKRFMMREVCADKAYSGHDALLMVDLMGATPYIPFKSNAKVSRRAVVWNRVFHFFQLHRDEFLERYHQRSNVESAFSAMKRKFGEFIRSRTPTAQKNEMLLKILAHNIVCLVHAMYELGIQEMFGYTLPMGARGKQMSLVR